MNLLLHSLPTLETAINLSSHVLTTSHPSIQDELEDLDVHNKLHLTHALLHDLRRRVDAEATLIHLGRRACHGLCDGPLPPIHTAISSVLQMAAHIRQDLHAIRAINAQHASSWFRSIYTPDCTREVAALRRHVRLHDERVTRLMEIVPVCVATPAAPATPTFPATPASPARHRRHSWSTE